MEKPLIIQPDLSVLLEVRSPAFREAREAISSFLELVKSPELFYTYRMTPVSLWNGFALGKDPQRVKEILKTYSRYPLPQTVSAFIDECAENWGLFKIDAHEDRTLKVTCSSDAMLEDISRTREIAPLIIGKAAADHFLISNAMRGVFKLEMARLNFPVDDRCGFIDGTPHPIDLVEKNGFKLRDYQIESIDSFFGGGEGIGGAGVVVLPCGAGKTVVGMCAMARLKTRTLIITPNIVALRQWRRELTEKSTVKDSDIGEYSGESKDIRPITLTTYQILVWRKSRGAEFAHFELFNRERWGLIIYDEIHLLPAPVFRAIASIQATRRLGLTATLVREDGREKDVFSLIGPKRYDLPWKDLEAKEFIANATCVEVKVPMAASDLEQYFRLGDKDKFRLAAENAGKIPALRDLLGRLTEHRVLVIGQYLRQLEEIAEIFHLPIITGRTDNLTRQKLYDDFRKGKIRVLAVSKVANFAIDLPDADVAVQISGTFGSRQEEAQRLGRIIRPKSGDNRAWFFTMVTSDSREEMYAQNRKRFLMEQGYRYLELPAYQISSIEIENLKAEQAS